MVRVRCPYCNYVWDYKGKMKKFATCPSCMRKVDIEKAKVNDNGGRKK